MKQKWSVHRHLEAEVFQLSHLCHFLQQALQPLLCRVGDEVDHVGPQLADAKLLACRLRETFVRRRRRRRRRHACGRLHSSSLSGRGASPISSALLLSKEVVRKVSSLQERVTEPTSSELVAKMRALSSDRLTPAMEATSLMSSSSLDEAEKAAHH